MNGINKVLYQPVSIAPLVTFRVLFGFITFVSTLRFLLNGWVESQYVMPRFFFSYYGFEWIKYPGDVGIYLLFATMAFASLGIMLGGFYRISAAVFFLSFTYVELLDKTNYLNHYYFVSIVALLMIFLPAHRSFSIDLLRRPSIKMENVSRHFILIIQVQVALVYFYAGLAKLNYDWLFEAMPLRLWLPPNTGVSVVGPLFNKLWVAYFFSWFGAVYDLTVPFFLFYRKTRRYAYIAVVAFHLLTWVLFPIGMFPFIMILATLIFFSPDFHQQLTNKAAIVLQRLKVYGNIGKPSRGFEEARNYRFVGFFALFLIIQIVLPWRFMLYPGALFWTEQGYRFSWRVMLMEKAGYTIFHIRDTATDREWEAYAHDHLTPMQEKQMSTQPDMILQYAHFLEQEYKNKGIVDPEVRVEAYVTLNGKGSRLLIDPEVDLTNEEDGFSHKNWILSYQNQ